MSKKLIRLPEVVSRTGLGRSAIYDAVAEGTFPKSVPLGKRAVGWLEDEVDSWIADRVAARDRKQAAAA